MESIGAPKARRSPWNANPMAFHAMRRLFALPPQCLLQVLRSGEWSTRERRK